MKGQSKNKKTTKRKRKQEEEERIFVNMNDIALTSFVELTNGQGDPRLMNATARLEAAESIRDCIKRIANELTQDERLSAAQETIGIRAMICACFAYAAVRQYDANRIMQISVVVPDEEDAEKAAEEKEQRYIEQLNGGVAS